MNCNTVLCNFYKIVRLISLLCSC